MPLYLSGRWYGREVTEHDARQLGFQFGLGVFTTLGVCDGHPLFLKPHLDRLEANARLLNLRAPPGAYLRALVRQGIRRGARHSGVIKIMVAGPATPEGKRRGLTRIALLVMPGRPAPAAVDLLLSPFAPTRWHAHKLTANLDSAILAGRARAARCFDALAVANGELLDTSMTNIFLVDRAGIRTPPADGRILPGIARGQLLAAKELGIREGRLHLRDLEGALGLFLTNSVRGIIPVGRILDGAGNTFWRPAAGAKISGTVLRAYRRQVQRDLGGSE